jgi:electron transfer flavoprotein alpha subunit
MPILVYAETWDGKFKKPSFEAMTYAFELAKSTNDTVTAVVIGAATDDELKRAREYGCSKVLHANDGKYSAFCPSAYTAVIADCATSENAKTIVFSQTYSGKSIAPRLAAKLKAGLVSGAIAEPSSMNPFIVRKKCFSSKGYTDVQVSTDIKIIAVFPNAHHITANNVSSTIQVINPAIADTLFNIKVNEVKHTSGKIALTEAEIVVSGGRGMKGPENWGMIEDLADALGAGTACSKPVADMGWRPHHEHVGQTGITISPNLYIAIGISGAIQHLAGISSSKVIVAINSDKEAPFFKIADYGIVGDAFQIVPKLTEAVKQLKASH